MYNTYTMQHEMILKSNPVDHTFSMRNPSGTTPGHDFLYAGWLFQDKVGKALDEASGALMGHMIDGDKNTTLLEVYKVMTDAGIPENVAVTLTNALKNGLEYSYEVTYSEPDLNVEGNEIPDFSTVETSLSNFRLVNSKRID